MALRVALEWLGACSGCEISFLNIGEELVGLLSDELEIVHAPLLVDHKYSAPDDGSGDVIIPPADIGFISGGVNNEEHLAVLEEMRRKCDFLVAMGTCATHGGIPALMNGRNQQQSWQEIFQGLEDQGGTGIPDQNVPAPLDKVYGCDEKTNVDLLLPGCPPNPQLMQRVIRSVIDRQKADLPTRSVCDTCPVKRDGKGQVSSVKRFMVNAEYNSSDSLGEMRCLLEQGFMCMGPVTLAGCAGDGAPSCIKARVPCRGCYGPVRKGGNQMLDMMNAMASNGIDFKSIVDRRSLLRFCGAHGRLRPLKKRRK
jgi:F420-non-reducing hydrogenase small subunit